METQVKIKEACLAGGCFWCLEAVFQRLRGVLKVQNGYTGGLTENPSYEAICTGKTGHAEAILITYDENEISFSLLLDVFFSMHNPCTLNRQGADIGTQYRSAIFYLDEAQKLEAEKYIAALELEKVFENKIVTEISALTTFYPAETYHDDYYNLNRSKNSYCVAVIDPKVNKLRKSYLHLLKPEPGL